MGKAIVVSNEREGEFDQHPTESKTTGTVGNFPHGSRDPANIRFFMGADRSEKARGHKSDMHVIGESDSFIVQRSQRTRAGCQAGGVGGGKETDQGEHRAVATGPDTEPEIERKIVGSQVARIAGVPETVRFTSLSTVRAIWGSSDVRIGGGGHQ